MIRHGAQRVATTARGANNKMRGFFLLLAVCGLHCADAHAVDFPSPASSMPKNTITQTGFPTTFSDLPRDVRRANLTAGYAPFKDASAYQQITLESEQAAIDRQLRTLEAQRRLDATRLNLAQYCDKYPLDASMCPQRPGLLEEVIAIGNNPTPSPAPEAQPATTTHVENSHQTPPSAPAGATPITATTPTTESATQAAAPVRATPSAATTQTTESATHAAAPAPATPITATTQTTESTTHAAAPAPAPTQYDYHTRGGACTPSDHSKWFKNKILTSGKYEQIDPAFEKSMATFFRMEGECTNDAADRGGYTCYGISQKANPDVNVSHLTRPQAEDLTYQRYYRANGLDKLPDSVRGDVLRGIFGSGTGGITKMQKVLNLPQQKTFTVSDEMVQAIENYQGDLHNDYWDTMQQFYIDITKRNPSQKKFLKGWMNSVRLMRENGCHVQPHQPLYRD